MKQKSSRKAEHTARAPRHPEWLDDPNVFVFAGEVEQLPVGGIEQHALGDWTGKFLTRTKAEVKADWEKVLDQMKSLLEKTTAATDAYELSEITFQLGFSAEGQIVFVAKAGVTTTISAKFSRKKVA